MPETVTIRTICENRLEPFSRHPRFSAATHNIRLWAGSSGSTEVHMLGREEYTDVLQQADVNHRRISSGWTFVGVISLLAIGLSTLTRFF